MRPARSLGAMLIALLLFLASPSYSCAACSPAPATSACHPTRSAPATASTCNHSAATLPLSASHSAACIRSFDLSADLTRPNFSPQSPSAPPSAQTPIISSISQTPVAFPKNLAKSLAPPAVPLPLRI